MIPIRRAHERARPTRRRRKSATKSPAVTTQPRSASVAAGRVASFTATAAGTPAPRARWQRSEPKSRPDLEKHRRGPRSDLRVHGQLERERLRVPRGVQQLGRQRHHERRKAHGHRATKRQCATTHNPAGERQWATTHNPAGERECATADNPAGERERAERHDRDVHGRRVGQPDTERAMGETSTLTAAAPGARSPARPRPATPSPQPPHRTTTSTAPCSATRPVAPPRTPQRSRSPRHRAAKRHSSQLSRPARRWPSTPGRRSPPPHPATRHRACNGKSRKSTGGSSWSEITGATSTSYSFTATSAQNDDEYRAAFTNSAGSATTNAATLTVAEESGNWSGYAATGGRFSSVSGSWTVPIVTCPADTTTYSSQWIGIDGYESDTVEQDGILAAWPFQARPTTGLGTRCTATKPSTKAPKCRCRAQFTRCRPAMG